MKYRLYINRSLKAGGSPPLDLEEVITLLNTWFPKDSAPADNAPIEGITLIPVLNDR